MAVATMAHCAAVRSAPRRCPPIIAVTTTMAPDTANEYLHAAANPTHPKTRAKSIVETALRARIFVITTADAGKSWGFWAVTSGRTAGGNARRDAKSLSFGVLPNDPIV